MTDRDRKPSRDAFFVGYLPVPKPLALFLAGLVGVLTCFAAGAALALALSQSDPGDAHVDGPAEIHTGYLSVDPYPLLHLPPDDAHPLGRTLPMAGIGKIGIPAEAEALAGQWVDARGVLRTRGAHQLFETRGRDPIVVAAEGGAVPGNFDPVAVEDLGEVTVRGEIVDPKCFLGAMRPGCGKMHMACANRCLLGGVPPMLASFGAEDAFEMFLLTDEDGNDITEQVLDWTSLPVSVTGALERRGDLFVLKVTDIEAL